MKKAYLVLENGQMFEGYAFGAEAEVTGELVFNTSAAGYVETMTDPAYDGQIVVQTFPMVGNYGIIPEDLEDTCYLRGCVVREWCEAPSNFRSQMSIDEYFKKQNIPGICGVDTRYLTRILRENGTMNAAICYERPEDVSFLKGEQNADAVAHVTTNIKEIYEPDVEPSHRVTLIDYGVRDSLIRNLVSRGVFVTVVPATYTAKQILETQPDGILLSGGPGDPAENLFYIDVIKALLGRVPMYGIGLGHQILALANGGMTYKLKYGHRGGNQPVKQVNGERTYITVQNHGYAVAAGSVTGGAVSFVNANDDTCEGIEYPDKKAFSVQFYPETCQALDDALFEMFFAMMGGVDRAAE